MQGDYCKKYKDQKSLNLLPFNMVEQLKKLSTNVSLWDILAILEQKALLQKSLLEDASIQPTEQPSKENVVDSLSQAKVLTNNGKEASTKSRGNLKPKPFFLTLIVGKILFHNSMIDFGASTIVIPKKIVEAL